MEDHDDDLARWLVRVGQELHWGNSVLLKYIEVLLHCEHSHLFLLRLSAPLLAILSAQCVYHLSCLAWSLVIMAYATGLNLEARLWYLGPCLRSDQ